MGQRSHGWVHASWDLTITLPFSCTHNAEVSILRLLGQFGSQAVYKQWLNVINLLTGTRHSVINMAKMSCILVPKTTTLPPHVISFTTWHPGPQKILVRFLQNDRFVGWVREKLSELSSNSIFMFLGRKVAKVEGKQCPSKWSGNARSYYRAGQDP